MNQNQYCTFMLGEHHFGIDVDKVQEIILSQDRTEVPLADSTVRGLINLRGHIVPQIDFRKALGLHSELSLLNKQKNIVVRTKEGPISLLIDQVGDIMDLESSSFEEPPPTVSDRIKDVILGAYKLHGRLVLILDIEKVIELNDESVDVGTFNNYEVPL